METDLDVYQQVKMGNLDRIKNFAGAHRVLYLAAEKGDTTVVKLIISMDPQLIDRRNERMNGSTPLMAACLNTEENVEIVRFLVENGADPTLRSKKRAWGNTAFHWAAVRGAEEALKILLRKFPGGRDILDADGQTPLQLLQSADAHNWFDKGINEDLENIDRGDSNERRERMIQLLQA